MLSAEFRQWRGGGTEKHEAFPAARSISQISRRLHCIVEGLAADDDVDHGDLWRIAHGPPEFDFLVVERAVILRAGHADAVVLRQQRLNDCFAWTLTAPGAPGDLRQQLKRALRRPEIG